MQLSTSPFLQLRSSGVCLFVSVYFSLFLVASVVLFSPLFRSALDHRPAPPRHPRANSPDYEWENSLFMNLSGLASRGSAPRGLRWPVPSTGPVNCSTLHEVEDLEFVAAGWTKAVYRGVFRGREVAVKTVNLNGHDFRGCQERMPPGQATLPTCYRRTAAKLLRELILLTQLAHGNIVKVNSFFISLSFYKIRGNFLEVSFIRSDIDIVKTLKKILEDSVVAYTVRMIINIVSPR